MKKNLLFKSLLTVLAICGFSLNLSAQATCHDESTSKANDFWLSNFYYSVCTDYEGTGSKLFSEDNTYTDFGGGSSIVFNNIFMSEDGEYTMKLNYGIGYADDEGAKMKLYINDEFVTTITLYRFEGERPAKIDIPVELYADWNNEIKLEQQKDWPILLGIELLKEGSSSIEATKSKLEISGDNSTLEIDGIQETSNVSVYSVSGTLVDVQTVNTKYSKTLTPGLYIAKVGANSYKVLVK